MASPEKERARNLVQLLWTPREGDRILLKRDKKYLRGQIDVVNPGIYLTSVFPGEFLTSRQMFFVPRQSDYIQLLWRFVTDNQILLQDLGENRYQMTRRYPKSGVEGFNTVFLVGSPVQLISGLLGMRLQDLHMNQYINGLVLGPQSNENIIPT